MFWIGQQILQQASTFAEAEQIFTELKPAAGWNYHVVSTKERIASTFELCADHVEKRPHKGDFHVTTNHWSHPKMKERHLWINQTVENDTRARKLRVTQMLNNNQVDAQYAAKILGDKVDPTTNRVRSIPNTVATSQTVSSSIWMPDSGCVYVARGRAPVSQNEFVKVPSLDLFDSFDFNAQPQIIENHEYQKNYCSQSDAEQLFIQARQAFEFENDAITAMKKLHAASSLDRENPAIFLTLALMCIRTEKYEDAMKALDTILYLEWDTQRNIVALYLKGRILAHNGQTPEALECLEKVIGSAEVEAKLFIAAHKVKRKIKKKGRLAFPPLECSPMTFLPDCFRYTGPFS